MTLEPGGRGFLNPGIGPILRNEDTAFALQKARLSLGSDDVVVYNGAVPSPLGEVKVVSSASQYFCADILLQEPTTDNQLKCFAFF